MGKRKRSEVIIPKKAGSLQLPISIFGKDFLDLVIGIEQIADRGIMV